MAEIKNSFISSKMNKDLDDRLIPNDQYRDALNIEVGKSEANNIGVLQNIYGNIKITPEDSLGLECIGTFMDNQNNRIFQFLTDYIDAAPNDLTPPASGIMKIVVYDFDDTLAYITLVEGLFLNFAKNKEFRITGVNLIEGLLFWTDNRNQPRKININLANPNGLPNPTYYTTEEQISVAKYAPVDPITLYKKETATVVSGSGSTYVLSNMSSLACTIGTVSGGPSTPYTATITTAVANGFANFSIGDVIAGTNGTGSFGLGQMIITSIVSPTNIQVSSTVVFTAGTASITLRYPYLGAIRPGATVLSASPTGTQFLDGSDYAIVVSLSNTTLTLYQPTTEISNNYILTFLISTMSDKSDIAAWPGDPAFLEDKYVRFSYRFKYDDNEYSLMAPFTQIAYIPKQKGYFIAGNETDAYRSTVLNWFENNINNIELIVPFPDKVGNLINSYKILEVDILYKESDSAAIKVFETVPISAINTLDNTNNNYYIQPYQSQKPYKTLSEEQTVRVYDKVPVRAKAQEVAGNRVIYGNYYDKYTCLSSINYNISIQPKSAGGTNFIEYPNHTLKKNRNYQVGFILADKFGRQSPVILSTVDLVSTNLGGGNYAKGSTVYSSYENNILFQDVRSWFGDALILYLNSPIDQLRYIPGGTPGLYAIISGFLGQTGSGFEINSGYIVNETEYYYAVPLGATQVNVPVLNNYLRGKYTDYVKVIDTDGHITCDGPISEIYNYNSANDPDIKYAYDINPIGWYSYKVVVKQQEQDYYNVYLPGVLNGYPKSQTSGSQVVFSGAGATATSTLENGINTTQFPVSETGNTSHIVLINDNINKVPRDLSEVGPDQKQYRSSVQLYGRVENTEATLTIIGENPTYSAKVTTITYSTLTVGQGDWAIIKPGDGIQCVEANAPIPNTPPLGGTQPNPYRWLGDTVVVSNVIAGTTGTITISSPNWIIDTGNPLTTYKTFTITRAENKQYFPTRKADTVIAIASADEFNFLSSSEDNLSGTAGLNFYQLQTKPLIGRVSTVNKIGVIAADMIPFLGVYETRAEQSLLELFWETATTGLISDLNADVLTGFDGPSSFGNVNYTHFEWQNPNGEGNVKGAANSKYITDAFYVLDQNEFLLSNTTVTLLSVTSGNGLPRITDFGIEPITGGPTSLYRLYIKNPFVFNNNAGLVESYVFEFTVVDLDDITTTTNLSISGRLGNNNPIITTIEQDYNITQDTTSIVVLEANNGSFLLAETGLKWTIVSGDTTIPSFSISPYTGELSLINSNVPLGVYTLAIRVQDAVNTSNGDVLPPINTDFGTKYDEIILTINVGDDPVPYWLRPNYTSTLPINGTTSCETSSPPYGMIYIGPNAMPDNSYMPEIPGSGGVYQFVENIEVKNASDFIPGTIIPTGLTQGEYRFEIELDVPAPNICTPIGFATIKASAEIYLYRRIYNAFIANNWVLINNENNWGNPPYAIGPLIVTTTEDGGITTFGQEQVLTTSLAVIANSDPLNLYEYAVGVKIVEVLSNTQGTYAKVRFYGQDANYSYPLTEPFSPPVTDAYTYYTGVAYLTETSAVPYLTQDATIGLTYNSPINSVSSGNIVLGAEAVEIVLSTHNEQIVPGLFYTFSSPSITTFNGYVVDINVGGDPNKIALQLSFAYSGTPGSLAGGNIAVGTDIGNLTTGALYANTEEGTEIKRFYINSTFTQKWIPPVANRFYNFITNKDYDPDITGKYSAKPYYCAFFNADGEVVNQTAPDPNVQTAWDGQNPANSGPLGIANYSYNVYYETP